MDDRDSKKKLDHALRRFAPDSVARRVPSSGVLIAGATGSGKTGREKKGKPKKKR